MSVVVNVNTKPQANAADNAGWFDAVAAPLKEQHIQR
jgi:hypothetical protein